MSKLRKALALSFATEYSTQLIAFVAVMILARILTPKEIGIFSIGNAVIIIAHEVRGFGVGQYVVQEKRLTRAKMSAAAGVIFLASWAVAALLAAASPALARFYQETGVQSVLMVLAATFLVIPVGGVISNVLQREMEFGKIYNVRFVSAIAYGVAVVGLALAGFSYMSMAWAALVGVIVSVLGYLYYRPSGVPVVPGFHKAREVLVFGSFASGASFLRRVAEAVPELVIGRLLTMAAVGYFSRAYGLLLIFNRIVLLAIRPVLLPHLSERRRANLDTGGSYLRAVAWITALAWPFYGFLALMAYPVIRILYGDQWDASVPIVQALCAWACMDALYCFSAELLVSSGGVRRLFWREAAGLAIRVATVTWLVRFGLVFVGAALAIVGLFEFAITSRFIHTTVGVSARQVLGSCLKSVLVTAAALAVPALVATTLTIDQGGFLAPFALAAAGAAAGWYAGVTWTRHEIAEELRSGLRDARRRLRGGPAEPP